MEALKALFWKIYLQILFGCHVFVHKRTWIDKHILLCYDNLDKLGSKYDKSWYHKHNS